MELKNVRDQETLIDYFADKLNWPIEMDDFDELEDFTYEFDADDLGLKEDVFAKISSIRQLQPLVDEQPWGIFLVDFDSKRFEITALRKILSSLVPSKRNSAEHAVWDKKNLLFLCTWGNEGRKTIGIAYFEDSEKGLPQIKMISCEPDIEDFTQIQIFEKRLGKLYWPDDIEDVNSWESSWSSGFKVTYRQTIQDSQTLVHCLAEEAHAIRDRILNALDVETDNGYVHKLYQQFRETLIHDMTEQQFADTYAQTIVYGLFSARCMDNSSENFDISSAVDAIPNTNPFLKGLMKDCLGSSGSKKILDFDELDISSVVDLLLHTQIEFIVDDFNRQTGGGKEDPVIHFYEEFLTEYDKSQKVQRGVFYTPQPVVNFMVRTVDDILKDEFGISDGLASIETKKIKAVRDSKRKRNGVRPDVEYLKEVPAIQVLDPATGTGTFLRQVILQIFDNFKNTHKGLSKLEFQQQWNQYVEEHLLPRLNGFELMMAPYAVAHMKLAMVLKDTGYEFKSGKRLQVYLTNSLEEPGDEQITLFSDPLAVESMNANEAKKNTGINVVIGNPPYAGESANKNDYIQRLMNDYKKEPGGKMKLQERNPKWLNDDYVKFIRYAQEIINVSTSGIVAFVNPHGFLLNPTFRGMRWQLLQEFNEIYVIDLHGNSNRKEKCPDGSKDENVFDIQQGVSICFLVKLKKHKDSNCKVYHCDLYGTRDYKYKVLMESSLKDLSFDEVKLIPPEYIFVPTNYSKKEVYDSGISVNDLFRVGSVGLITARDGLNLSFTSEELSDRLNDFFSLDDEVARDKYNLGKDVRDWSILRAKNDIRDNGLKSGRIDDSKIIPIMYRVFDNRYMLYTGTSRGLVCYPRNEVTDNFILGANIGLVTGRTNKSDTCDHFLATKNMVEVKCAERSTGSIIYPLYLYSKNGLGEVDRTLNLNRDVVEKISSKVNAQFRPSWTIQASDDSAYSELELFSYIYAIFYSNKYRNEYAELLKTDYPKFPIPKDLQQLKSIGNLGAKLVALHTSFNDDSLTVDQSIDFVGDDPMVSKVTYKSNGIWINKSSTFKDVKKEEWEYILGGYQVLKHWFKNRKGRILSNKEIEEYKRIISIIRETMSLQRQIDAAL